MKSTVTILFALMHISHMAYSQKKPAMSTQEMRVEASDVYKQVDNELNDVYRQILDRYKSDSVFVQKLKLAQREWINSRDADLAMIFPYQDIDAQRNYGTIYPICYLSTLTEITKERIKFLRKWIDTIDDGEGPIDVCNGSIIPKRK